MWSDILKGARSLPVVVWIIAAAALLLMGAVSAYTAHQREIGRWQARSLAAEAFVAYAGRQLDSLGRLATAAQRRDTVRVAEAARWRVRWDTVRVSDTVSRVVLVQAADSAISACEQAGATCRQRLALAEQQAGLLTQQRDTIRQLVPVPASCGRPGWQWGAGGAVAGLLVGRFAR